MTRALLMRVRNIFGGDDIFYLSLCLISIFLLIYSWLQPWAHTKTSDGLSLAAFPAIFCALAAVLSLTGLSKTLLGKRDKESKQPTKDERFPYLPAVLLSGVTLALVFGLWKFDSIISTVALVLLLLLAEGTRDWRLLVGIPIGCGLLIYILFFLLLDVYFPHALFS